MATPQHSPGQPPDGSPRDDVDLFLARMILNNVSVIICKVDRDMRIQWIRGRTLDELGLTESGMLGTLMDDWLPPNHIALIKYQAALTGEPQEFDSVYRNNVFEVRIQPLWSPQGEVVGAISFATDVTQKARTIEQSERDRGLLTERVRLRTMELQRANDSLQKERRLLGRMLELQERDRQFVSYEIHDGICQQLTAALMFVEAVANSIVINDETTKVNLDHGIRLVREAIGESRRLIEGLRPPIFDGVKLADAVAQQVNEVQSLSGIEIHFQADELPRMAPTIELAAFRIVQESLTNVWRHSGSDEASVSLQHRDGWMRICVRDSGRGFDPAKVVKKRYGLTGVKERARLLGGEAHIDSAPGKGTTIDVVLPVTDVLMPTRDDPPLTDEKLANQRRRPPRFS
jgi:signal transduction histidine kinase